MKLSATPAVFFSVATLSGCAVGTDYLSPDLSLPAQWHAASQLVATPVDLSQDTVWWKSFADPMLDQLMERALKGNHTRQIMQSRVLQARGAARSATGALLPQMGVEGAAARYNLGEQTFDKRFSYYQGGFDASYELDFFGGNRRRAEASDAAVEASEADYDDATLTLTAEVARHYVLWRQYQQQARLAESMVADEQKLLSFAEAKHKPQIISDAELAQAKAHAQTVAASAPQFQAMRDAEGYQLSVLLGENPGALNDELAEAKPIPTPQLVATLGAPADVIARRPDVKAAERRLAAATAMQGAAFSELFPKLSLSAFYGIQDSVMFGTNPIWSLMAGATLPILNFGRINGQIDQADARQVEALHAYQNTVLAALAEVETSLTNLGKEGERVTALKDAAANGEKNMRLMEAQEKQGTAAMADVLLAKQQWVELQQQQTASLSLQAQDAIALYKALALYQVSPQKKAASSPEEKVP